METLIARMKESSSAVADAVALLYAEQRSLKHTVLAENELLKARIATLENELRNRGIVHPDFPQILHSRVVDLPSGDETNERDKGTGSGTGVEERIRQPNIPAADPVTDRSARADPPLNGGADSSEEDWNAPTSALPPGPTLLPIRQVNGYGFSPTRRGLLIFEKVDETTHILHIFRLIGVTWSKVELPSEVATVTSTAMYWSPDGASLMLPHRPKEGGYILTRIVLKSARVRIYCQSCGPTDGCFLVWPTPTRLVVVLQSNSGHSVTETVWYPLEDHTSSRTLLCLPARHHWGNTLITVYCLPDKVVVEDLMTRDILLTRQMKCDVSPIFHGSGSLIYFPSNGALITLDEEPSCAVLDIPPPYECKDLYFVYCRSPRCHSLVAGKDDFIMGYGVDHRSCGPQCLFLVKRAGNDSVTIEPVFVEKMILYNREARDYRGIRYERAFLNYALPVAAMCPIVWKVQVRPFDFVVFP